MALGNIEKQKIKRFVNDQVCSDAVYDVLLKAFIADRPGDDVQTLAASRLAIDYLKRGWKELTKFKNDEGDRSPPKLNQVGI